MAAGTRRGLALGLAAALKVLTGWGLLFALRGPHVWRGAALAVLAGIAVMLAGLGPDGAVAESVTWLRDVVPVLGQGEFWRADTDWSVAGVPIPGLAPGNLSLSFLPVQLLVGGPPLPGAARVWLTVSSVGSPLLAGWMLRRRPLEQQVAGVLAAAVLFSPICRLNYLPMLVPCALVFYRARTLRGAGTPTG